MGAVSVSQPSPRVNDNSRLAAAALFLAIYKLAKEIGVAFAAAGASEALGEALCGQPKHHDVYLQSSSLRPIRASIRDV